MHGQVLPSLALSAMQAGTVLLRVCALVGLGAGFAKVYSEIFSRVQRWVMRHGEVVLDINGPNASARGAQVSHQREGVFRVSGFRAKVQMIFSKDGKERTGHWRQERVLLTRGSCCCCCCCCLLLCVCCAWQRARMSQVQVHILSLAMWLNRFMGVQVPPPNHHQRQQPLRRLPRNYNMPGGGGGGGGHEHQE